MKISIVGCGWLGLPLGKSLVQKGHQVIGTTTSLAKIISLQQAGIKSLIVRFNPLPDADIQSLFAVDVLIIALPPRVGQFGQVHHLQQIDALVEPLTKLAKTPQIIYISSTSVYPENNQITTENAEILEDSVLIKAENLLKNSCPNVVILRCGGLMGYDRIPGKYFIGKTVNTGQVPVNFVHRDDVIAIIDQIITEKILAKTFNVVAPIHPIRQAIYLANAQQFGWEAPQFEVPIVPIPFKIISSDALIQALNYEFIYPNPLYFF